ALTRLFCFIFNVMSNYLIPLLLLLSTDIVHSKTVSSTDSKVNSCVMRNMHVPGMNPFIRTDSKGKTCRINLTIPVCRGYCRTQEYGTHNFPHRSQKSDICTHEGGVYEAIPMDECDDGADPKIRTITILKGSKCVCKKCDRTRMHCMKNSLFN
uniref:Glycoprotein hormone subunit beta domain-containing protein n=1 Tax=Parascaris univalens TaxID=6257 RepID=A0A915BSH7_PARUN